MTANSGKRIGLLRDVLPRATTIAVLAVPSSSTEALAREKDAQKAARLLGLQIKFLIAGGGRTLKTIDCRLSRPASSAVR
jgi:hypothetical protein